MCSDALTISNASLEGSTLLLTGVSEFMADGCTIEGATRNADKAVVDIHGGGDVTITDSTIGGTMAYPAEQALTAHRTEGVTMTGNHLTNAVKGVKHSFVMRLLLSLNLFESHGNEGEATATAIAILLMKDDPPNGNTPAESNIISGNIGEPNRISANTIRGSRGGDSVTGIQVSGDTRTPIVENNRIYDLDGVAGGPGGEIAGIKVLGANGVTPNTILRNNMISLSPASANHTVIGIQDSGFAGNTFTADHNSVYIGGAGTGTTASWAYRRDASSPTTHTARNNIAYNNRTGRP